MKDHPGNESEIAPLLIEVLNSTTYKIQRNTKVIIESCLKNKALLSEFEIVKHVTALLANPSQGLQSDALDLLIKFTEHDYIEAKLINTLQIIQKVIESDLFGDYDTFTSTDSLFAIFIEKNLLTKEQLITEIAKSLDHPSWQTKANALWFLTPCKNGDTDYLYHALIKDLGIAEKIAKCIPMLHKEITEVAYDMFFDEITNDNTVKDPNNVTANNKKAHDRALNNALQYFEAILEENLIDKAFVQNHQLVQNILPFLSSNDLDILKNAITVLLKLKQKSLIDKFLLNEQNPITQSIEEILIDFFIKPYPSKQCWITQNPISSPEQAVQIVKNWFVDQK